VCKAVSLILEEADRTEDSLTLENVA